jgi:hypothetical protein
MVVDRHSLALLFPGRKPRRPAPNRDRFDADETKQFTSL